MLTLVLPTLKYVNISWYLTTCCVRNSLLAFAYRKSFSSHIVSHYLMYLYYFCRRDASAQGVHIVGGGHQQHPPHHAAITMSSELAKLGCNTNSPMNVIPAHLQSPRNIASSHAHITNLQVTPTESATSPVHSMLLQSPKEEHYQQEQERRIRREIANSNERRRMQSINAGFKNLKSILPHTEGEKLSKVCAKTLFHFLQMQFCNAFFEFVNRPQFYNKPPST